MVTANQNTVWLVWEGLHYQAAVKMCLKNSQTLEFQTQTIKMFMVNGGLQTAVISMVFMY